MITYFIKDNQIVFVKVKNNFLTCKRNFIQEILKNENKYL